MEPIIKGKTKSAIVTNNTVIFDSPGGVVVGNLIILTFVVNGSATISNAAGFSLVNSSTETGSILYVYSKVADSSDASASTFTITLSASVLHTGAIFLITGQRATTPIVDTDGGRRTTNATTVTAPSITLGVGNCLLMMVGGIDGYTNIGFSAWAIATSNPAWTVQVSGSTKPCFGVATAVRPESTDTGTATATYDTAEHNNLIILAIAPEIPAAITPNTSYRVRAFAINEGGISYGSTVDVETLPEIPSAQASFLLNMV